MKKKKLFARYFFYLILIITGINIVLSYLNVPEYIIPKPVDILKAIQEHFFSLLNHSSVTFLEALLGLILGFALTLLQGVLFTYYPVIGRIVYPFLFIFQMIPLIVLMPIFIIWFGFTIISKVVLVALLSLFPMLVSFLHQAKNIDPQIIYWMRLIRFNKWQIFKEGIFPYCFYSLISGLKISTTYSISTAIVAEFFGSSRGLGVFLGYAFNSLNTALLFAIIIFIIVLTSLMYLIVVLIEKKLVKSNINVALR